MLDKMINALQWSPHLLQKEKLLDKCDIEINSKQRNVIRVVSPNENNFIRFSIEENCFGIVYLNKKEALEIAKTLTDYASLIKE